MIRCSDCPREFHSSCAWKHGDKFGFEIQPVGSICLPSTPLLQWFIVRVGKEQSSGYDYHNNFQRRDRLYEPNSVMQRP